MTRRWITVALATILAFLAGRLTSGGHVVRAQHEDAQVELRSIGPDASLMVYYPEAKRVYVYSNPLLGGPASGCAYMLTLSGPGGAVTREQCKPVR